ncbi:MAG TPA: BON domain-containing protein [Polyangiaceae bacterium]|nr:BON domain-containing protein [Polyangiaceae bacterium]
MSSRAPGDLNERGHAWEDRWNEYPSHAQHTQRRDAFDDQWDRQHQQHSFADRESRYGGYGEGRGGYGEGRGDRRFEEAGGYTGGHRNAWNDSPRYGVRSPYGGAGQGNTANYGSGYGTPSYSSRYASTSRYGGPFGSGYGSPYDDQNRFPGEPFGSSSSARQQRGPFAGKGPKGYARSDDRIREDACERLTYDSDVDASDVTVTVSNGEVTLSGEVENRHQKRLAEDLVEDVNGVRDVHNRLSARRGVIGSMVDEVTGRGKDENNAGKGPRQAS